MRPRRRDRPAQRARRTERPESHPASSRVRRVASPRSRPRRTALVDLPDEGCPQGQTESPPSDESPAEITVVSRVSVCAIPSGPPPLDSLKCPMLRRPADARVHLIGRQINPCRSRSPRSERTAIRAARRSLRSLCVPESSEHPRNATNTSSTKTQRFGGFRPYRWTSRSSNQSGRPDSNRGPHRPESGGDMPCFPAEIPGNKRFW